MLRDNRIESKTAGRDWSYFNLSEVKLGKVSIYVAPSSMGLDNAYGSQLRFWY